MSKSRQRTAGYVKWGIAGLVCTVAAACASAGSGAGGTGAIPVAALLPISGSLANFGERTADGVKLGVDEVNAHGGVMGRPLSLSLGDDGGDAVDAVPAFRQLETHNPAALFGPVSPTFPAVQQLIEAAHIPTFAIIANVPYDKLQNPYVFHAVVSDSVTGAAMAAFALQKGFTHAAVLFASDASSQTLSGVVATAYKGHGGTIATDVSVSPDQSTYSTELAKIFATHPDAVFIQADAQTSGTIFADARQLGFDKIPWIGSDEYTSIEEAKAIGLGTASKYLTAVQSAPASGPATTHFTAVWKAAHHSDPPPFSANMYDSVIIAALAMTEAKSTDPAVWVKDIRDVASPPGQVVYTYQEGVAALAAGKKINYEGAYSSWDFNQYGDIFSDFDIVQWNSQGTQLNTVYTIKAGALAGY